MINGDLRNARADRGRGVKAVNINLGPERIDHARLSGHLLTHVRRDIMRKLRRALDREVDLVLYLESVSKHGKPTRPHLHGVLGVEPKEVKTARRALQGVAGDAHKATAVRFSTIDRPFGWADYVTKQLRDNVAQNQPQGFTITNDLRARAREAYEDDRAAYLARPKSSKRVTHDRAA